MDHVGGIDAAQGRSLRASRRELARLRPAPTGIQHGCAVSSANSLGARFSPPASVHARAATGRARPPVGQRRAIERDALAPIDLGLTPQRQDDRHISRPAPAPPSPRSGCRPRSAAPAPAPRRPGRTGRPLFGRRTAISWTSAGTMWRPGHILADAMELAGTAGTGVALDVDHHLDPRQMRRQRAAVRAGLASPGRRRRCLPARCEPGGSDQLGPVQPPQKVALAQGLGPTATEAVPLQRLDDLAQTLDRRVARDQHRLKRLGMTRRPWREQGHSAASIMFVRAGDRFEPAATRVAARCGSWSRRQPGLSNRT
ncbi:hypothetical protein BN1110_00844 [bacterium YEK0313]|nr:hypothetical protein BN1110_00844 [bacterium YEK0313]